MPAIVEPASKPTAGYCEWDARYAEIVYSLVAALNPPPFFTVEHVGSTAIERCGGKGIIDLLALYENDSLGATKDYLLSVGFCRQGAEFARRWPEERPMYLGFYRWRSERFLIYVHVISRYSDEVSRFRTFRDRISSNPELIAEYCSLKREIVASGVADTDDYAVRKREFIRRVLGADHESSKTA